LALGGILSAGLDGIEADLPPPVLVNQDPASLSEAELQAAHTVRLPTSLQSALNELRTSERARSWLSAPLLDAYLLLKEYEIAAGKDKSTDAIYERYLQVF
jgi:glutamine synthetase